MPEITVDRRASLFVFPTTPAPAPVTPAPAPADEPVATSTGQTSELRATLLLFGLVLLIPTIVGVTLLGMR